MPFCISIAQRTASTTLRNSMMLPSPVRLTMRGDCRVYKIAAKPSEPRQRPFLIDAGQPAIADDVGDENRC
jgi:hypothetical protein